MTIARGKYQEWITPDGLLLIEGWARDGLTDEQIAKKIGISSHTLYEWNKKYPQIYQTLKKGKAPVDIEVQNALLKRARGMTITETIEEVFTNGEDAKGKPIVKSKHIRKVTREIPPDTAAAFIWLKNRRPDKWRDKHDIETQAEPIQIIWGKHES